MINITMNLINSTAIPVEYITDGAPAAIKAGSRGAPAGMITSTHADPAIAARWNHAITALIKIVLTETDVVAVDHSPNDVYLEIAEGKDVKGINISRQQIQSTIPLSTLDQITAVTALFVGSDQSEFAEVKTLYQEAANSLKTVGKIPWQTALKYCHSFYYTVKETMQSDGKGSYGVEEGEVLSEAMIKQMARFKRSDASLVDFSELTKKSKSFKFFEMSQSAKTATTPSNKPIIERCRDGEFIIPYPWTEEQKQYIPSMDYLDLYIPSQNFEDTLYQIKMYSTKILENMDMGKTGQDAIGNNGKCFLFTGKPGTGKSTTIKAICAATQTPFYMCAASPFMEEDEFQGKTKLDHQETQNAAFKFCETPFLKAFENGGIAVIEEFNLAMPAVIMAAIGQAIEKPYILNKDGYMPITKHPLCFLFFTANSETQGSQSVNEALLSRMPHVLEIEDPKEEEFLKIIEKNTSGVTKNQIKTVFDCYSRAISMLRSANDEEGLKAVTLRACLGALDEIEAGIPLKRAVEHCVVNPLLLKSKGIVEDMKAAIIGPLR